VPSSQAEAMGGNSWDKVRGLQDSLHGMGSSLGSGLTALDPSGYLGGNKPREPETALERLKACSCCPGLSYRQRLLGSILCFAFGTLISLSALNSLGSLLLGNAAPFAFKYTLGNLLQIGASTFLVGPAKQLRDMASPERATASLVYGVTLAGTLWSVFWLKVQVVSFGFILCQFCALTWYMLSYVPYGQACVLKMMKRVL